MLESTSSSCAARKKAKWECAYPLFHVQRALMHILLVQLSPGRQSLLHGELEPFCWTGSLQWKRSFFSYLSVPFPLFRRNICFLVLWGERAQKVGLDKPGVLERPSQLISSKRASKFPEERLCTQFGRFLPQTQPFERENSHIFTDSYQKTTLHEYPVFFRAKEGIDHCYVETGGRKNQEQLVWRAILLENDEKSTVSPVKSLW